MYVCILHVCMRVCRLACSLFAYRTLHSIAVLIKCDRDGFAQNEMQTAQTVRKQKIQIQIEIKIKNKKLKNKKKRYCNVGCFVTGAFLKA